MAAEHSSQLKCQEGACRGCCDVCLPEPVGGWETVIVGSLSTSFHAIRKRGEGIRIRRLETSQKSLAFFFLLLLFYFPCLYQYFRMQVQQLLRE